MTTATTVDLVASKALWAGGDCGVMAALIDVVGERLADGVDLVAGSRVLDVAGGNFRGALLDFIDADRAERVHALPWCRYRAQAQQEVRHAPLRVATAVGSRCRARGCI
jgi:hypothetical protein